MDTSKQRIKSNRKVKYIANYIRNWFSNMYPFDEPLQYDGLSFKTPEHFYQAMKSTDRAKREFIARQRTGRVAKKAGRKLKLREDWEEIKYSVMEFAQRYRFKSGTTWYTKLMETEDPIVETNNWHDNEWGNCICEKCKDIEGKNMLGKILTDIRNGEKQ